MSLAMRVQLALLLVYIGMSAHLASAANSSDFLFTSTKTEEVPASARVNSDQVYTRTWQVRANTSATTIEGLEIHLEGVAFISYAEDTSGNSDLLATVKVSGRELPRVDEVVLNSAYFTPVTIQFYNFDLWKSKVQPERQGPMMYEIVLHKKRTLKRVVGSNTLNVVIEDNVLFTTTKEAVAAFPVPHLTTGVAIKAEESARVDDYDTWDIKTTANVSNTSTVVLGFVSRFTSAPVGIAHYCSFTDSDAKAGRFGRVQTAFFSGSKKLRHVESEVSVVRGSDFDSLALQVDTSSTTFKIDRLDIILTTPPFVQVQLLNLTSNVTVRDRCARTADPSAGLELNFQKMPGNVYIVDRDAALFATEALFAAPMGTMQIEVKELTTTTMALHALGPDSNVNYFSTGATTSSQITAAPNGQEICLSSRNNLKVALTDPRASPLVSYPGHASGSAFKCKKRAIPKRVPADINSILDEVKNRTAPPMTTSSTTRASSTGVAHAVMFAVGLVAAAAL